MSGNHWLAVGAVSAALAIATGAFAAHMLEQKVQKGELQARDLEIFKTGAQYQMYHALALVALGGLVGGAATTAHQVAGWSFLLGTILFSGSLYGITFTGVRALGMITPIGGSVFIVGWIALAVAAFRAR